VLLLFILWVAAIWEVDANDSGRNQTVTESEIDGEMISGTKLVRYPSQ
jgi:hypothetical protein